MKRYRGRGARIVVLVAGLLLTATEPGASQDPQEADPTGADGRLSTIARLRWTQFENYFQAPVGRPDSVVQAVAVSLEMVLDAWPSLGAQVYADGHATGHDSFDASYGLGTGIRLGPRALRLDVGGRYDLGLPRLDLADSFARADVAQLHGSGRLRLGKFLELSGTGRATWQAVVFAGGPPEGGGPDPRDAWEDHTNLDLEARVRTRILGYAFSPEFGIGRTRPWSEEGSPFAYLQEHWLVQIRSVPTDPLYLSFRYRVRDRSYPWAPEESSSFGRTDQRRQFAVSMDLTVREGLTWNVYVTQEVSESSLSSRSFRTHAISLGVTVRY